ncbi:hypothetical protein A1F94_002187 [Pyrenophora tritici-repentis]|nr:hypothetical protein A1F94_002187 [Pyrenophora tritici-repentis]
MVTPNAPGLATIQLTLIFSVLFKTYGIPSISSLLVATGQLSSPNSASKRAADTGVVITEVVLNTPSSERTVGGR